MKSKPRWTLTWFPPMLSSLSIVWLHSASGLVVTPALWLSSWLLRALILKITKATTATTVSEINP
jgi:hypothetical protein